MSMCRGISAVNVSVYRFFQMLSRAVDGGEIGCGAVEARQHACGYNYGMLIGIFIGNYYGKLSAIMLSRHPFFVYLYINKYTYAKYLCIPGITYEYAHIIYAKGDHRCTIEPKHYNVVRIKL